MFLKSSGAVVLSLTSRSSLLGLNFRLSRRLGSLNSVGDGGRSLLLGDLDGLVFLSHCFGWVVG